MRQLYREETVLVDVSGAIIQPALSSVTVGYLESSSRVATDMEANIKALVQCPNREP